MKIQNQISVRAFQPASGFIADYQRLIRETVIPYQYSVLCDEAPDTEKSHVVQNFANAARALRGEDALDGFYGMVFQDSDAAKWLEAAACSLSVHPDAELEQTADRLIDLIADAQDSDGYLNTYYTIKDREKRWTNLLEGHELYCSGHMMEAACAYYEATGKRKLLEVMERNADHIYDVFITRGHEGYPGHPEVELALMKMYRTTGNEKHLELARHFVDVRGVDPHFFEKERTLRDWTIWGMNPKDHTYSQSAAPVRDQQDAVGHAVRAVYLYTAMADIASQCGDEGLFDACRTLWNSITQRQMYITGAIGSTVHGEAFSTGYDLPNSTVYGETCASIGLMMFASRMLEQEVSGEYADVMELAFYNTVLAGMQADGKHFFYVNPLEVIPGISGVSQTQRHVITQRPRWYGCACCPPNAARLISSFGKYAYGESASTAYCHLYAQGRVSFRNGVELTCETGYPYDFTIRYSVRKGGRIAIRIPARCRSFAVEISGLTVDAERVKGYIYLDAKDGDQITVTLDDGVRFIYPSSKIPALTGMVALMRGPLVYCFEGVDNGGDVLSLRIDPKADYQVQAFSEGPITGSSRIVMNAFRTAGCDELYSDSEPALEHCTASAIPYYLWANRGETQMRVWMGRT